MCDSCNENNNEISEEDILISKALYLDGIYVECNVLEHVIENAKHVGLISKNYGKDDDNHRWVVSMVKHQMLILKLQDIAKEKPYTPLGVKCLDAHIKDLAKKISKVLAVALLSYSPVKR
ncbi:hypothetical protein [Vibrio parahaemolyticus]|uniref:hypothetical protein n=1 Tax=Vibrio parahaemolyticus TaxID=670 RepID=UPI0011233412|nr:hypothetical protein [Vibrio parahaemolyticus]TOG77328.1 hypothetical protein CGI94_17545 [Vibrio parahaemolyticus]HCG8579258.1 hypothetical protein [Vibrio parahaemolyticus]HCH0798284.1 hypothetical protein [Vibrio parahaemolyticus]HCH0799531.1 hypothetical protein [Vibrio parahaemolyticus]